MESYDEMESYTELIDASLKDNHSEQSANQSVEQKDPLNKKQKPQKNHPTEKELSGQEISKKGKFWQQKLNPAFMEGEKNKREKSKENSDSQYEESEEKKDSDSDEDYEYDWDKSEVKEENNQTGKERNSRKDNISKKEESDGTVEYMKEEELSNYSDKTIKATENNSKNENLITKNVAKDEAASYEDSFEEEYSHKSLSSPKVLDTKQGQISKEKNLFEISQSKEELNFNKQVEDSHKSAKEEESFEFDWEKEEDRVENENQRETEQEDNKYELAKEKNSYPEKINSQQNLPIKQLDNEDITKEYEEEYDEEEEVDNSELKQKNLDKKNNSRKSSISSGESDKNASDNGSSRKQVDHYPTEKEQEEEEDYQQEDFETEGAKDVDQTFGENSIKKEPKVSINTKESNKNINYGSLPLTQNIKSNNITTAIRKNETEKNENRDYDEIKDQRENEQNLQAKNQNNKEKSMTSYNDSFTEEQLTSQNNIEIKNSKEKEQMKQQKNQSNKEKSMTSYNDSFMGEELLTSQNNDLNNKIDQKIDIKAEKGNISIDSSSSSSDKRTHSKNLTSEKNYGRQQNKSYQEELAEKEILQEKKRTVSDEKKNNTKESMQSYNESFEEEQSVGDHNISGKQETDTKKNPEKANRSINSSSSDEDIKSRKLTFNKSYKNAHDEGSRYDQETINFKKEQSVKGKDKSNQGKSRESENGSFEEEELTSEQNVLYYEETQKINMKQEQVIQDAEKANKRMRSKSSSSNLSVRSKKLTSNKSYNESYQDDQEKSPVKEQNLEKQKDNNVKESMESYNGSFKEQLTSEYNFSEKQEINVKKDQVKKEEIEKINRSKSFNSSSSKRNITSKNLTVQNESYRDDSEQINLNKWEKDVKEQNVESKEKSMTSYNESFMNEEPLSSQNSINNQKRNSVKKDEEKLKQQEVEAYLQKQNIASLLSEKTINQGVPVLKKNELSGEENSHADDAEFEEYEIDSKDFTEEQVHPKNDIRNITQNKNIEKVQQGDEEDIKQDKNDVQQNYKDEKYNESLKKNGNVRESKFEKESFELDESVGKVESARKESIENYEEKFEQEKSELIESNRLSEKVEDVKSERVLHNMQTNVVNQDDCLSNFSASVQSIKSLPKKNDQQSKKSCILTDKLTVEPLEKEEKITLLDEGKEREHYSSKKLHSPKHFQADPQLSFENRSKENVEGKEQEKEIMHINQYGKNFKVQDQAYPSSKKLDGNKRKENSYQNMSNTEENQLSEEVNDLSSKNELTNDKKILKTIKIGGEATLLKQDENDKTMEYNESVKDISGIAKKDLQNSKISNEEVVKKTEESVETIHSVKQKDDGSLKEKESYAYFQEKINSKASIDTKPQSQITTPQATEVRKNIKKGSTNNTQKNMLINPPDVANKELKTNTLPSNPPQNQVLMPLKDKKRPIKTKNQQEISHTSDTGKLDLKDKNPVSFQIKSRTGLASNRSKTASPNTRAPIPILNPEMDLLVKRNDTATPILEKRSVSKNQQSTQLYNFQKTPFKRNNHSRETFELSKDSNLSKKRAEKTNSPETLKIDESSLVGETDASKASVGVQKRFLVNNTFNNSKSHYSDSDPEKRHNNPDNLIKSKRDKVQGLEYFKTKERSPERPRPLNQNLICEPLYSKDKKSPLQPINQLPASSLVPLRYNHKKHASIGEPPRSELDISGNNCSILRAQTFRKAGIPEEIHIKIKKALEKQKEMLKKVNILNPYNDKWTKKMLRNHFNIKLEAVEKDDHFANNRWKIKRIKKPKVENNIEEGDWVFNSQERNRMYDLKYPENSIRMVNGDFFHQKRLSQPEPERNRSNANQKMKLNPDNILFATPIKDRITQFIPHTHEGYEKQMSDHRIRVRPRTNHDWREYVNGNNTNQDNHSFRTEDILFEE